MIGGCEQVSRSGRWSLAMSAVAKTLAPEDLPSRHRTSRLALYALAAYGRVPGHTLDAGPIQLLMMLLANGPVVHIKRRKLGARLGVSMRTVSAYAERLSAIVLDGVPLLRRHAAAVRLHAVPPWQGSTGHRARANLQSYELAVEALLAAIEAGQRQERAAEVREYETRYQLSGAAPPDRTPRRPAQRQPCGSSQGPFMDREDLNRAPPQETPPDAAGEGPPESGTGPRAPTPPAPQEDAAAPLGGIVAERVEASGELAAQADDPTTRVETAPASAPPTEDRPSEPRSPSESESAEQREQVAGQGGDPPATSDVEATARELAAAWEAQGLVDAQGPSRGADARRVILARLRAGYSAETLRAVIAGAGADDWMRRGRAIDAFAVVFSCRGGAIERFAHRGRKILAAAQFGEAARRRTAPTADAPEGRVDGQALSAMLAATLKALEPLKPGPK
jgi:hypothetical protein